MDGKNTIQLEVVTPDLSVFNEQILGLVVRALDGDIGILPHHAPLIAALDVGPLIYTKVGGSTGELFVAGGFLEVKDNKITILAPAAEVADAIDVERAEKARKRAEERLRATLPNVDVDRARLALKRAMGRLKIAHK